MGSSAVKTAFDVQAKYIFALSESGATALAVAKYRPSCPIIVLTHDPQIARQLQGYVRGISAEVIDEGSLVKVSGSPVTEVVLTTTIGRYVSDGKLKSGDVVVFVYGQTEGVSGNTDSLRVVVV